MGATSNDGAAPSIFDPVTNKLRLLLVNVVICKQCKQRRWFDCDIASRSFRLPNGNPNPCSCCVWYNQGIGCKSAGHVDPWLWQIATDPETGGLSAHKPKYRSKEKLGDVDAMWRGQKPNRIPPQYPDELVKHPERYLQPFGRAHCEMPDLSRLLREPSDAGPRRTPRYRTRSAARQDQTSLPQFSEEAPSENASLRIPDEELAEYEHWRTLQPDSPGSSSATTRMEYWRFRSWRKRMSLFISREDRLREIVEMPERPVKRVRAEYNEERGDTQGGDFGQVRVFRQLADSVAI